MGTPRFAAEILDELAEFHEIAAVYTRPDAVRGRGKALVPSPVKEVAERRGLPVRTPRTLRDAAVLSELAAFAPDAICVAAYGAILPKEVLDLPPFGCLNVHGSLLPRWRGAAPIERAILAGDEEIGVCIMAMEEGLDTGDYCVCRSLPAGSRTAAELTEELAALGASALLTALAQAEGGNLRWVAQDEALVTYAEKIAKAALAAKPADVDALKAAVIDGETVEEIVTDCIHVMGENTQLARVAVVDAQAVSAYIHGGGKIGVLVTFNVEGIDPASDAFQKCGRDIAMQVAALNPVSATREDVPADVAAHEMEIYKAQAAESGKPEAIQEKIALGRMDKFYKENCLAEQDFVKNPDLTVAQYADECAKEMGGKIAITGFVRFALGE